MRISPIQNHVSKAYSSKPSAVKKNQKSFKGIYIDNKVTIGETMEKMSPPVFLKKDALLLNEIAQMYPNQDCFISRGYWDCPMLEYREKPPQVQTYSKNFAQQYIVTIDSLDKEYPTEPLLLYKDASKVRFYGMTSFISLNPSLPYTVKVGYELHKKLLEKKYQIMEVLGRTDEIDLGEDTLIRRAHKEVEDIEVALTRYLLECSFAALSDRASAQQIYASNYPKVQSRLDAKRKLDLLTSVAKQPTLNPEEVKQNKVDICEEVMKMYPNMEENKKRIDELTKHMNEKGLWLNNL